MLVYTVAPNACIWTLSNLKKMIVLHAVVNQRSQRDPLAVYVFIERMVKTGKRLTSAGSADKARGSQKTRQKIRAG